MKRKTNLSFAQIFHPQFVRAGQLLHSALIDSVSNLLCGLLLVIQIKPPIFQRIRVAQNVCLIRGILQILSTHSPMSKFQFHSKSSKRATEKRNAISIEYCSSAYSSYPGRRHNRRHRHQLSQRCKPRHLSTICRLRVQNKTDSKYIQLTRLTRYFSISNFATTASRLDLLY